MVLRQSSACLTAVILAAAFAVPVNVSAGPAAQGATSSVNGRVTDNAGAVLPNAEVSLVPIVPAMPGMKMTPPPPIVGRVNNDGSFTVAQVPAGQYVLQVDAPGYGRSSQEVTVPTTQTFNVKLEVLEIHGAEGPEAAATPPPTDAQAMEQKINELEQRVRDLEASTVCS